MLGAPVLLLIEHCPAIPGHHCCTPLAAIFQVLIATVLRLGQDQQGRELPVTEATLNKMFIAVQLLLVTDGYPNFAAGEGEAAAANEVAERNLATLPERLHALTSDAILAGEAAAEKGIEEGEEEEGEGAESSGDEQLEIQSGSEEEEQKNENEEEDKGEEEAEAAEEREATAPSTGFETAAATVIAHHYCNVCNLLRCLLLSICRFSVQVMS